MGYLGKVLIGGSLGVLAVAAVPFTGGGSLFGAATIAGSLAGAGGIAGAVGVAGAGVGALVQGAEDNQKEKMVKTAKEYAFQDGIKKNKDIPEAITQKLGEIAVNENIAFEDVKIYLDNVSTNTLKELEKDIDEIIMANGEITTEELEAKERFITYLCAREREERADV